jgi:hypothetical protein
VLLLLPNISTFCAAHKFAVVQLVNGKFPSNHANTKAILMSEKKVKFEFEKQNKNSIRFKEIPEDGMPPVVGSIYVQKWFAGNSKNIEVTISKKD